MLIDSAIPGQPPREVRLWRGQPPEEVLQLLRANGWVGASSLQRRVRPAPGQPGGPPVHYEVLRSTANLRDGDELVAVQRDEPAQPPPLQPPQRWRQQQQAQQQQAQQQARAQQQQVKQARAQRARAQQQQQQQQVQVQQQQARAQQQQAQAQQQAQQLLQRAKPPRLAQPQPQARARLDDASRPLTHGWQRGYSRRDGAVYFVDPSGRTTFEHPGYADDDDDDDDDDGGGGGDDAPAAAVAAGLGIEPAMAARAHAASGGDIDQVRTTCTVAFLRCRFLMRRHTTICQDRLGTEPTSRSLKEKSAVFSCFDVAMIGYSCSSPASR